MINREEAEKRYDALISERKAKPYKIPDPHVNCGKKNGPKPTLDQYDDAPVNR